jgi:transposase-like protein
VKVKKRTKYTSEFKEEAVKLVVEKGHAVPDVAQRLHAPAKSRSDSLSAYF